MDGDPKSNPDTELQAVSSWTPRTLATPSAASTTARTRDPITARRLALAPFAVLGLVQLVFFTMRYAPETVIQLGVEEPGTFLYPLAANTYGFAGTSGWQPWPTLALLGSLVLAVLAYTPGRRILPLTLGPAIVVALATIVCVAPTFTTSDVSWLSAAVLAAVVCVTALLAPKALALSRDYDPKHQRPGLVPFIVFALTVYPPIAVGRWLYGDGIERRLLRRGTDEVFARWDLHAWYWLGGVSVALAIWATIQLIPPYRGRSLTWPVLVLVACVLIGIQVLGPHAVEATQELRILTRR